jgi:predicted RNase H-like nuclease (RuvC/YqgF family)
VVVRIEPSSADCGMEAGGNQVLSTDSEDCALVINVAMPEEDEDEDEDKELPPANWEGITVEDYDRLYRLLHAEYKDFDKRQRSRQRKIQGLEGEIKDLHSRIMQLEGEIEDLKAWDDEELRKLAKIEEVQALEANMRDLEGKLEFERGH